MLRIKKIEREGEIDLRRIYPDTYGRSRQEFADNYGVTLPRLEDIHDIIEKDMRLLLHTLIVRIYCKDGTVYRYNFRPGWITDLASVPKCARSFVDNDDREIMLAALVHDHNFGGQRLAFTEANRLFRKMIIEAGGSRWLAFKAWVAVASPIGYIIYRKMRKAWREVNRERRFVRFMKVKD